MSNTEKIKVDRLDKLAKAVEVKARFIESEIARSEEDFSTLSRLIDMTNEDLYNMCLALSEDDFDEYPELNTEKITNTFNTLFIKMKEGMGLTEDQSKNYLCQCFGVKQAYELFTDSEDRMTLKKTLDQGFYAAEDLERALRDLK